MMADGIIRLAWLALQVAILAGCVADADILDELPDAPPICACDPPMRLDLKAAPDAGSARASTATTTTDERDR